MLLHHSSQPYEEAASQAARHARDKLGKLIAKGSERGLAVYNQVATQLPDDRVAAAAALRFETHSANTLALRVGDGDAEGLHRLALDQAADRARLPRPYLRHLVEEGPWGADLAAHNLNQLFQHDPERYLVRSIGNQVRGVLSSRYRRMDSAPLLDAFMGACQDLGAVPVEGYALDTKVALKAVLGRVFEPVPNEVMAFGVVFENSDFGHGPLQVSLFMLRLWCTNYAIAEVGLRRVHLGSRLTENIGWSAKTMAADTRAMSLAIGDMVRNQLGPSNIHSALAAIRRADSSGIGATEINHFVKKHLDQQEAKGVVAAFNSADVLNLPAGQTRWRFSNALSFFAQGIEDGARRLDMMKLAGAVLDDGAKG